MLRRDMSSTPPIGEALPKINKFVGESFGVPNVRTIYAGAEEDRVSRESRVVLLVGPAGAGKSSLIDFLCNYFYDARLEGNDRFHIANEKFDGTTPEKSIITYVFNDAYVEFRPIVIDTPGTGTHQDAEELSQLLSDWLQENNRHRIDLIGVVISHTVRMSSEEESQLQKTLDLFPAHMRKNMAVFITGSDGSPKPEALLRRLNLQDAKCFKVNTSCLFQSKQDDPIHEHLRGTHWRMTIGHFTDLYFTLRSSAPVTISGAPPELPFLTSSNSSRLSSGSSSAQTIIQKDPPMIHETVTRNSDGSTTTTKTTIDRGKTIEERTIVHPPKLAPFHPSVPPPPPPPPPADLKSSATAGLPRNLLDDIRNLRKDDAVEVVEYDLGQPEVVLLHNSPSPNPPDSPPRDLPPSLGSLTRSYDIPPSEFYKTVTTESGGTTTRFSSTSFREGTRMTVGTIGRSYDEPPRTYKNETTPPLPEVTNVSTTYSTLAHMNDNGTLTTDHLKTYVPVKPNGSVGHTYSPYDETPTMGVKSSPRNSALFDEPTGGKSYNPYQEDYPVIMRTPATPRSTSLSQQMRHSIHELERMANDDLYFARSQSTRERGQVDSDVIRYVYDVGSRSHRAHAVGGRTSARSSQRNSRDFEGRYRSSRSLETITRRPNEEPFYSASGFTLTKTPNRSSTSLHRLSHTQLELVHSEDNYAIIDPKTKQVQIQPKPQENKRIETLIDDPSPIHSFDRDAENRKSMRPPSQTQIGQGAQPVPKRRTSSGKGHNENRPPSVYPPPANIDNRTSPEYNLRPDRPGTQDQVSKEMIERDQLLKQTNRDVNRDSYPSPPRRIYDNLPPPNQYVNIGEGVQPQQPQNDGTQNHFIIPENLRDKNIEVTIGMRPKEPSKENLYDAYAVVCNNCGSTEKVRINDKVYCASCRRHITFGIEVTTTFVCKVCKCPPTVRPDGSVYCATCNLPKKSGTKNAMQSVCHCGSRNTAIRDGKTFCTNCNTEIQYGSRLVCKKCGSSPTVRPDGTLFCGTCRHQILNGVGTRLQQVCQVCGESVFVANESGTYSLCNCCGTRYGLKTTTRWQCKECGSAPWIGANGVFDECYTCHIKKNGVEVRGTDWICKVCNSPPCARNHGEIFCSPCNAQTNYGIEVSSKLVCKKCGSLPTILPNGHLHCSTCQHPKEEQLQASITRACTVCGSTRVEHAGGRQICGNCNTEYGVEIQTRWICKVCGSPPKSKADGKFFCPTCHPEYEYDVIMKKTCKRCGSPPSKKPDGSLYCPNCRTPIGYELEVTTVKVCKKCGSTPSFRPDGSIYCATCRTPIGYELEVTSKTVCKRCGSSPSRDRNGEMYCANCRRHTGYELELITVKVCKKCGSFPSTRPDGSIYCATCRTPIGYELEVTTKTVCKRCGTSPSRDKNGDMYCPNCRRQSQGQYAPPPQVPPHQYQDKDYGDNWDGDTSVVSTIKPIERDPHQGRPADLDLSKTRQINDPRQYPTTPDHRNGYTKGGDDSDAEAGPHQPLKGKNKRPKRNDKKVTNMFAFKPCSCGTTRDCLLNIICFIFAPLFLLAVIITLIVISVVR